MMDIPRRNAGNLPFPRGEYTTLIRDLRLLRPAVGPWPFLPAFQKRGQPNRVPKQIRRHPFSLSQFCHIYLIIKLLNARHRPAFNEFFGVASQMPSL
jgi:hypothetical protein